MEQKTIQKKGEYRKAKQVGNHNRIFKKTQWNKTK
jgi:hypothetical protein